MAVGAGSEPFAAAREHFGRLVVRLGTTEVREMEEAEVERLVRPEGTETMRLLMQGYLTSLGHGVATVPVIGADGAERTHRRLLGRNLITTYGQVRFERYGYSLREIAPLFPLDARLNLPPLVYSHEVSRQLVREVAKSSFDEAVASLGRMTGAVVPKRQAEELTIGASVDFDRFYEQAEREALTNRKRSGPILVITADGKGVVVRREDLREATQKAAAARKHSMMSRLGKGEKRNVKRMAEVAAVYTIRRHRRSTVQVIAGLRRLVTEPRRKPPKPEFKRVWASVIHEMEDTLGEAFLEALRRDPMKRKEWVGLVDGNRDQLKILSVLAKRHNVSLFIVIDFIHALEYLWNAGHELYDEGRGRELEDWVLERAERLLNGEASLVGAAIRRSATMLGLEDEDRKAIDKCADYFINHSRFMRYDICLAKGYPIATGVIEGACRHLVKDRMDLTGARWGIARAEAVLRFRALLSSGDFDSYWAFHEAAEYRRNHLVHYRGPVPQVRIPAAGQPLF